LSFMWSIPGFSLDVPLLPEGSGGGSRGNSAPGHSKGFVPPGRSDPLGNIPWVRSIFLLRIPSGEGKRRKDERPPDPHPFVGTSGDAPTWDGWIPGPIQLPWFISRRKCTGVPGWSLGVLDPLRIWSRRTKVRYVYRTPGVLTAWRHLSSLLPRHLGHLYSFRIPFGDLSPRPFLQRSRRTVSERVLGMGAKIESFARRSKV
jgi:hypothetical protein